LILNWKVATAVFAAIVALSLIGGYYEAFEYGFGCFYDVHAKLGPGNQNCSSALEQSAFQRGALVTGAVLLVIWLVVTAMPAMTRRIRGR
jgi:hypothetical protein